MKSLADRLKALARERPSRRDVLQLLGLTSAACAAPSLLAPANAATPATSQKSSLRQPRRVISARHPLFMVEEGVEMWRLLPEEFRHHCAAEAYAGDNDRRRHPPRPEFFAGLERAQKASIPVVLAVQGDEDDGPPVRLDFIAKALEEFPNLIGCRSCELSCGPGFSASERSYLIDLIHLVRRARRAGELDGDGLSLRARSHFHHRRPRPGTVPGDRQVRRLV